MIAELWAMDAGDPNPQARVNILTYAAWRALGRQVRKGEHGRKLETWIPIGDKPIADDVPADDESTSKPRWRSMRRKLTTVFHEAQRIRSSNGTAIKAPTLVGALLRRCWSAVSWLLGNQDDASNRSKQLSVYCF